MSRRPLIAVCPTRTTAAPVSFDELYATHSRELLVHLQAYLGDHQEAQDIVQEAFCRAYARWFAVSRYDNPAAWVRTVAWNLAASRWRRLRAAATFLTHQPAVAQHAPGPSPDRVALVRALATLPDRQRRAVVLHYVADLPIRDIAAQEGVADGTVKAWLHRGRTALADRLDPRRPTGPR